jgi:hypothetical protein
MIDGELRDFAAAALICLIVLAAGEQYGSEQNVRNMCFKGNMCHDGTIILLEVDCII